MIAKIKQNSRSFKAAAATYLSGERRERVAWTHTLNLPTDDPELASKIMTHTAMCQAELKAAAGVKNTGRKLAMPVLPYALFWHPDDEPPTREEQHRAVTGSLKVLDLEEHQALIICDGDRRVRILVNRVNPDTGKAATIWNSKVKLSKWAQAYRQEHRLYGPGDHGVRAEL